MEEATKARLKGDYRQAFLLSRGDMNQETSLLGIYREAEACLSDLRKLGLIPFHCELEVGGWDDFTIEQTQEKLNGIMEEDLDA